jgi:hypothetical protein
MLDQLRESVPRCQVFVLAPFMGKMGNNLQTIGSIADTNLEIRDALKTTAEEKGAKFLDVLESARTGLVTTLTADASGSSMQTAASIPIGSIVRVGALGPSGGWTTRVTTEGGSTGAYTHTISPNFQTTWASGLPVEVVGPAFHNGTGSQGTPNGVGTSDFFVSSDNTHPTVAGHENIGRFVYALMAAQLDP